MEVLAPREQHSNQFVPSDTSTTPQGLTCPWFTPSVWALLEKNVPGSLKVWRAEDIQHVK